MFDGICRLVIEIPNWSPVSQHQNSGLVVKLEAPNLVIIYQYYSVRSLLVLIIITTVNGNCLSLYLYLSRSLSLSLFLLSLSIYIYISTRHLLEQ